MHPAHRCLIGLVLPIAVGLAGLVLAQSAPPPVSQAPPYGQPPVDPDVEKRIEDARKLWKKAALLELSVEKVKLLEQACEVSAKTVVEDRYCNEWATANSQLKEKKAGDANVKAQEKDEQSKKAGEKAAALAGATGAYDAGDWAGCIAEIKKAGALAVGDKAFEKLGTRCADKQSKRKSKFVLLAGVLILAGGFVAVQIILHFKMGRRRLEMVEGPEAGRVFKLEKELTAIGAAEQEDIDWVIPDPYHTISRRHCEVARSGRHFFLIDRSRNGTFINGRAIRKDEPVLLRRNDEITLADDVVLIFR